MKIDRGEWKWKIKSNHKWWVLQLAGVAGYLNLQIEPIRTQTISHIGNEMHNLGIVNVAIESLMLQDADIIVECVDCYAVIVAQSTGKFWKDSITQKGLWTLLRYIMRICMLQNCNCKYRGQHSTYNICFSFYLLFTGFVKYATIQMIIRMFIVVNLPTLVNSVDQHQILKMMTVMTKNI